jgi:hypothetical protein
MVLYIPTIMLSKERDASRSVDKGLIDELLVTEDGVDCQDH